MEGRAAAKPYVEVLRLYPQYREEIDTLPYKFYEVISKFPYKEGTYDIEKEDFFNNLVLYCMEANSDHSSGTFLAKASCKIETELEDQRRKTNKLYNPYRNLCLDKCYGESNVPLRDWMNFSTEDSD